MHVGPQTNRFWKIRIGNEKIEEEGGRRSILVSPPAEGKLAPILFRATKGHPSNQPREIQPTKQRRAQPKYSGGLFKLWWKIHLQKTIMIIIIIMQIVF